MRDVSPRRAGKMGGWGQKVECLNFSSGFVPSDGKNQRVAMAVSIGSRAEVTVPGRDKVVKWIASEDHGQNCGGTEDGELSAQKSSFNKG